MNATGLDQQVTVIGLGSMGLQMASKLTSRYRVTGFDVSPDRCALAEQAGIAVEATPAAAARGSEVILFAVRDRAQLEQGLYGDAGVAEALQAGSVVMLTSTIGPDAAIAVAAGLHDLGVEVVDAPVSGGPDRAGRGELLIFVGAPPESIDRVQPILDCLATTLVRVGPRVGDGQLLKVINQLLAGVHIAAAAEAIALASGAGLDPAVVVDALAAGAGGSFMFSDRGPRMVEALTGEAEVKSRVDIFVKDMGLVTDLAKASGVRTPLARTAQDLYLLADSQGMAARDDSTVVRLLLDES